MSRSFHFAWVLLPVLVTSSNAAAPSVRTNHLLVVKRYDVAELFKYSRRMTGLGHPGGPYTVEDVARQLVEVTRPEMWDKPGVRLREIGGRTLEIRTTAIHHLEIADLLEALRRLADLAVFVHVACYETDATWFIEKVEPLLRIAPGGQRLPTLLNDEGMRTALQQASRRETQTEIIPDKEKGPIYSLRDAHIYQTRPGDPVRVAGIRAVAMLGARLEAQIAVTVDRRSVELTIRQETTELAGSRKKRVFDGEDLVTFAVPNVVESATSDTIQVDDGKFFLVPLQYCPDKGKKLFLVVQPVIHIEEEDKARREEAVRHLLRRGKQGVRLAIFPWLDLYYQIKEK